MVAQRYMARILVRSLAGFALCVGIWSCDLEARSAVKSGDVVDLLQGTVDEVLLEASIQFPRPSDDIKADLMDFLSRHFRKFGNVKQVDKGLSSFLSADVAFPLRRAGTRVDPANDDLLTVFASEVGNSEVLSLKISDERFAEISKFVYERTMQDISLKDLSIAFDFTNVSSAELDFWAGYCFVEGEPVLERSKFTLLPGETKEIRLADVFRDYIAAKGSAEILSFNL
jgi:hypothetical protein